MADSIESQNATLENPMLGNEIPEASANVPHDKVIPETSTTEDNQHADDLIARTLKKADVLLHMMQYSNAAAGALFTPPRPTAQADPAIATSDPCSEYEIETGGCEFESWAITEPMSRFGQKIEAKNLIQSRWALHADREVVWCTVFDMTVGLIGGWYMTSPRSIMGAESAIPRISHWSDAVFMQWEMAREEYEVEKGVKAASPKYILCDTVENEDTENLVHAAVKTFDHGSNVHNVLHAQENLEEELAGLRLDSSSVSESPHPDFNQISRFKGESGAWYGCVTFSAESREGRLLLGSPHGACSAYLLAQHKDQLGHKCIDRVSILSVCVGSASGSLDDSVQGLSLLFHVKDVETEPPVDIESGKTMEEERA